MKRRLLVLAMLLSIPGAALFSSGPARADGFYFGYSDGYGGHYVRDHRSYRPRRVCRTAYRREWVWRHHRRYLIQVPVGRRCYWVERGYRRY